VGRGWRGVASLVISGAPLFLLTDHSDGIVIRVVDHCLRAEIAEARGELTSIKDTGGWTPGMF